MADSDIQTAVARALEDSPDRNFTETVDLAINLRDLDLNEPSNRVDESIVLPSGTGQETRIVVIAEGETAVRAEEAADEVPRATTWPIWTTTKPRTWPTRRTSSSPKSR